MMSFNLVLIEIGTVLFDVKKHIDRLFLIDWVARKDFSKGVDTEYYIFGQYL